MDWLISVVFSVLLSTVHAVSLNPFAAFADSQYEPVADYSIHRGVYLQNMPTTSIFPIMAGENVNSMVGIPSLQSAFANPLLQQQSSLYSVPKQNVRPKLKNTRINPQHQSSNVRDQVRNAHPPRGVTLDLRGGGYRLEQTRPQRPYKPPGSNGGPMRNTALRPNNNRNTASTVNRKQVQRPRNPPLKNPQYNMKFQGSMPTLPPNAEFVNPENVLPLHPRIYKQFLQQNPEAAAYLRGQKPSRPGSSYAGSPNTFSAPKPSPPKVTRNRGPPPNSQLASSSPYSNVPTNFQIPSSHQAGIQQTAHFNLQNQATPTQGFQPTFEDFYNADPQFYASLSQSPEGKAMLNQLYQQYGSSASKPTSGSPNKSPQSILSNPSPFSQTIADINSYAAAAGYSSGNTFTGGQTNNQYANILAANNPTDGQFSKQNVPEYTLAQPYSQNQQQSLPQQQTFIQNQPALQHQPVLQQPQQVTYQQPQQVQPQSLSHSSHPSSQKHPSYSVRPTYTENSSPPAANQEPKKQYQSQTIRNPQNPYSGHTYSEDVAFSSGGSDYDPSTYQSHYQENPKVVDGSTVDHAAYSSNFSPVDPLATTENTHAPAPNYYSYPSSDHNPYSASSSRFPSSALHEISPNEGKRPSESNTAYRVQPSKTVNSPGYWTPEQLFAPESTGLQKDSPFSYPTSVAPDSQPSHHEQVEGGERAALHLPEDSEDSPVVSSSVVWTPGKPEEPSIPEYGETSEHHVEEVPQAQMSASIEQSENTPSEEDSDEHYRATVRDLQKLWTRLPQRSSTDATRPSTVVYRSTSAPEVWKSTRDDLRNHRTTPSYTFQYSPSDKTSSKSTAAWWSRKPDGNRYRIPPPQPNTTTTVTLPTTTTTKLTTTPPTTTTRRPTTRRSTTTTSTTAATSTTTTTERPETTVNIITTTPASTSIATTPSPYYLDTDTPLCARLNNLTYCLQDPEYPKEAIREAIERNRHPLDHFLVDISAASNFVEDQSLHTMIENSAPLQSTSVSYSFEGKVISPNAGETNSSGCNSNVYYAKPLRALNTAGLWKVIVNVEFEDTGANYTQTVRIEECSHPPGYVATCGVHSISACLQQYKLYRLLSWEPHRGFYIDAFLLPIACFCGSQESESR